MDINQSFAQKCFLFRVQCCANMPSGFRNIPGKFSNSAVFSFYAVSSHNKMALYTTLFAILAFFLLYGGPFVLPANHFAKSPWLMSKMCPSMSCCNGSDLRGTYIGEFQVLLFIKWYIYIHNISYRMQLLYWSNIPC